ncbi:c-type cytochrome [Ideonella sp.]|uniref:c-type cytochrome n=1 Tax=Ideonella sp. TaxID=1929293 RepID=UPI0035B4716A
MTASRAEWRRSRAGRVVAVLAGLGVLGMVAGAWVAALNVRGETPLRPEAPRAPASADQVAQGAYLARVGNCIGCHTAPGGALLAGGRGVTTPFGTVFAPNLTPDPVTGLGAWTADEFWRALHHGRSRDGRLLYPAFPYPQFTQVTREDADALLAYLRSVPAVVQPHRPHALRFPYGTQAALAVWRALYFRPAPPATAVPRGDAQADRGRYLVEGLAHCAACHSPRDRLGGVREDSAWLGGAMPGQAWHAPSLADPREAGVQRWPAETTARLLRDGTVPGASVSGPMAEVVFASTQHLSPADALAMARYLASLPERAAARPPVAPAPAAQRELGQRLYTRHCADCHGERGEGQPGRFPALAGNRAVTLAAPQNVLQMIRHGGFAPATAGHPRPHGMPPFAHVLDAQEQAAVATYIRQAWGEPAPAVGALEVLRLP